MKKTGSIGISGLKPIKEENLSLFHLREIIDSSEQLIFKLIIFLGKPNSL